MLTSTQHILQIVRHIIMITLYIVAATFALWIYQHATKDNRIRSNTDKQIMEEIYRLLSPDYVPTSITIMEPNSINDQTNPNIESIIPKMQKQVLRLARHAGSWYEHDKTKLDKELTGYLQAAKQEIPVANPEDLKALIGPHAGFYYSGRVSAWSYAYFQQLHGRQLRIFMVGPSHHVPYEGISLSGCTHLQTPFGNMEVDLETIAKIKSEINIVELTKRQEEDEHSLELHMPFVKKVFGDNIKIVPIMVGTLDAKMAEEYGKLMVKYYEDPNTIFIVSTDFCHWGINYDYQPYDKQSGLKIWEYIKRMDEEGMKLIEKNDINGFWKYIRETQNSVCGEMGIKIFMNALQNSKQKYVTKFVQYDQSNNVENWDDFSVSYATSITYRV